VHYPDDPEHRENRTERPKWNDRPAEQMNVLDSEPRPPQVERDRDLDEELLHRAAAEDVVEDSQPGDGQAAEDECKGAAAVGVEDAAEARRVEDERKQRRVESGDDCNAAEARHPRGMHLARARDV